jgi:anhydro-N-acetylmuramic acid kinase
VRTRLRVIGLMSGTSCDGVDAAVVRVRRHGTALRATLETFATTPYTPAMRRRLLRVAGGAAVPAAEIAALAGALGERFAAAVSALRRRARARSIDLVGCHGHTVHHDPTGARVTLQLGEAAIVAVRTGLTTVADFRPADVAAGGQGAPLVPFVHAALFRDTRRARAVQNLGGIGNVTYLPPGRGVADVRAFDTGPGNIVIDGLVRRLSHGRHWLDRGGVCAARGRVDDALVARLLRHEVFRLEPPKSTGRELFGEAYVDALVTAGRRRRLSDDDLVATATALTAASCADAYRRFLLPHGPIDEVVLCGGGADNPTLVGMLRAALPFASVRTTAALGVPAQAVEAVAFAVLAAAAVWGMASNVPAATGAARALVLGKIVPGANYASVTLTGPVAVGTPRPDAPTPVRGRGRRLAASQGRG